MIREIKSSINQVKKYTAFANTEDHPSFGEKVIEATIMIEIFRDALKYGKNGVAKQPAFKDSKNKKSIPDIALSPTKKEKILVEIKTPKELNSSSKFKSALHQISNYIANNKKAIPYGILTSGTEWYLFVVNKEQKQIKILLKFPLEDKITPKILLRMQKSTIKSFLKFLDQVHNNLDDKKYNKLSEYSSQQIVNELLKQSTNATSEDKKILKYIYKDEPTRRKFIHPVLPPYKLTKK